MNRLISQLAARLANLFSIGSVKRVDDSTKAQTIQATLLEGETRSELERYQNYGFTSVPLTDAEVVVLFPSGRRDHGVVIAVEDRRYRLTGLTDGEVALYDQTGTSLVLKANGDIEVTPSSGVTAFTGDVTVSGTLTATTDVVGGGKSLKNHTHGVVGTVAAAPGSVVFVPTGTTEAPG